MFHQLKKQNKTYFLVSKSRIFIKPEWSLGFSDMTGIIAQDEGEKAVSHRAERASLETEWQQLGCVCVFHRQIC